ncbi:FAD-dependent oxidoreductase [Paraburkholderia elongata]|uniref:FAD-dependent oxidoreductase n=1 Tax=Paraburkholderia elongata TaxID=2675747 RepID=UPI002E2D7D99|nr:FAD-dependent oxidoreductase [Paraburkholderia elongata]
MGAGSGGIRASRRAAAFGARVSVAEQRFLGGTCVNIGCIPKKLLSYAAHFKKGREDSRGYGWSFGQLAFDWRTLLDGKHRQIRRLNGVYGNLLNQSGVELIRGRATVTEPHTAELKGRTFPMIAATPSSKRRQRRDPRLDVGWRRRTKKSKRSPTARQGPAASMPPAASRPRAFPARQSCPTPTCLGCRPRRGAPSPSDFLHTSQHATRH